mmetsp:Transcript_16394/g.29753  ORF Transcript_16394/g.29753 Transcript_16394/m.29753 type:complete len:252 (+) Transcript_16394:160-915(+)
MIPIIMIMATMRDPDTTNAELGVGAVVGEESSTGSPPALVISTETYSTSDIIGTINVLAFHISVKHSIAGINSRSRIGPDVGHDRLSHGVIVIDHLCPRNGCSLHTISGIVLAIGRVEPLRRTIIGHALICHPKLESRKSKMRMTILAGVLTGVDVRTEITPDIACISHILSAIVRTTAVPIVTSRRFASIFKLEVGVAGRAINQDWTLELDGVSFIVTEVFEHKFIERVLFDAATTRVKVKPVVAHLVRA